MNPDKGNVWNQFLLSSIWGPLITSIPRSGLRGALTPAQAILNVALIVVCLETYSEESLAVIKSFRERRENF